MNDDVKKEEHENTDVESNPLKRLVMPCPRIELKWLKTGDTWRKRECIYYLVLPLGEFDIRREDKDGDVIRNENYIEVNRTKVTGGRQTPPIWEDGEVETPFRDGAHAKWDSAALGNIPVFAVCGDAVSQMNVEA